MKTLKFVPQYDLTKFPSVNIAWKDDVNRIIRICYDRGYIIDEVCAQAAWEEHSDSYAACWLLLDDDDDFVFRSVMQYCECV